MYELIVGNKWAGFTLMHNKILFAINIMQNIENEIIYVDKDEEIRGDFTEECKNAEKEVIKLIKSSKGSNGKNM